MVEVDLAKPELSAAWGVQAGLIIMMLMVIYALATYIYKEGKGLMVQDAVETF